MTNDWYFHLMGFYILEWVSKYKMWVKINSLEKLYIITIISYVICVAAKGNCIYLLFSPKNQVDQINLT